MSILYNRRGASLIELLVTIVLLSVMTTVATMAVRRIEAPDSASIRRIAQDSLRRAIAESRAARLMTTTDGRSIVATFNADGSVTADSAFHLDRLTGRVDSAR